jgi:hypothetical protein
VRQSETARKGNKRGFKITAGAGTPLVGSGNVGFETQPHDTGSESSERIYDPLWSNALTLLDYLEAAGLIGRDLARARLGQFVIASGDLTVLNASMLQKIFESANFQEQIIKQASNAFRKQWNTVPENAALNKADKAKAEATAVKTMEENARVNAGILLHYPYSAQCTIIGSGFSVWSTLSGEGMVGTVTYLSLKHGTNIPGTWHLLGILDALPSLIPPQILIPITFIPEHFDRTIMNFSNMGRTLLGRKPEAYGMTALLLFREVSARSP